ncbi:hypothetical protein R1sor_013380 [Riccia sorocarpa]|uniref:Stomatal closure-related actin-binding protein 1 n=1 Tax=Riccia sorocarpa TaxID=122646 RepID=A0ABD3HAG8_9MARC
MQKKSGMSAVSGDVPSRPSWAHSPEREESDEEVVVLSKKDEVAKEAAELLAQQKRLSVRDLASKYEKAQAAAQAAAAKVAAEHAHHTRVRETTVLDKEAAFKKLRGLLTELRGRLGGRNKDDIEEGLKAVETLAVLFTQRESELVDERAEVGKMATLFKQASADAKTMVEEARAVAQQEIEAAKATAAKVSAALHEQEEIWTAADKKELEDLKREAQEARRIKMLHESSKAMDMEHQIEGLRQQLAEKVGEVMKLRKELEAIKRQDQEGVKQQLYQLTGHEHLGTTLSIVPLDERVSDVSLCSIQWYRISGDGSYTDLISGAIRPQYAPEPFDVGNFLRAEINLPTGKIEAVQTSGPIDPAPGLEKYVELLVTKGGAQFNVRIVLKNGDIVEKQTLHTLDINKARIKLHKGRAVKAKENYSTNMQLCGARGGGDSAAQGLYWVPKKGMTFMLVLESERERNAAILLARKFSKLGNIHLGGPDDILHQQA